MWLGPRIRGLTGFYDPVLVLITLIPQNCEVSILKSNADKNLL